MKTERNTLTDNDIDRIAMYICRKIHRHHAPGAVEPFEETYSNAVFGIATAIKEYLPGMSDVPVEVFILTRGTQRAIDAYRARYGRSTREHTELEDNLRFHRPANDEPLDSYYTSEHGYVQVETDDAFECLPLTRIEKDLLKLHFIQGYTRVESLRRLGFEGNAYFKFNSILEKLETLGFDNLQEKVI